MAGFVISKLFLLMAISFFFSGSSGATLPGSPPRSPSFDLQLAQLFGDKEGELHIQSVPAGATVYLDGKPIGRTVPREYMKERDIRAGKDHELRLVKEGYKEHVETFRVKAGKAKKLIITLEPLAGVPQTGVLAIGSIPPDAEVFVEGRYVGRTPSGERLSLSLPAGAHTVTLHKEGYEKYLYRFEVERGGRREVTVRLEALPVAPPPGPRGPVVTGVLVPNLLDLSLTSAMGLLRRAGLRPGVLSFTPAGDAAGDYRVSVQEPPSGARLPEGGSVNFTVGWFAPP